MNNFVDFALLGKVKDFDIAKDDPYLKGKACCVTSFVSKGGRVGQIIGYEKTIKNVKSIVDSECRYREGDVTPDGNTLRQIMMRFVLICDNVEQLVKDVETINNSIIVLDDKGQDMCYRFDVRNYFMQ